MHNILHNVCIICNVGVGGQAKKPLHEALFWYDGADQWAVRLGEWKLLSRKGSLGLYNLEYDISEKHDLKEQNAEIVERLRKTFDVWKSQLAPSISKPKRDRQSSETDSAKKRNRKKR